MRIRDGSVPGWWQSGMPVAIVCLSEDGEEPWFEPLGFDYGRMRDAAAFRLSSSPGARLFFLDGTGFALLDGKLRSLRLLPSSSSGEQPAPSGSGA